MKFGQVTNPHEINFTIPPDHKDNLLVLASSKPKEFKIYIGCAKWNKTDLKNFYPKGTKDELKYYSSQFNSIELNATFYRLFAKEQFEKWRETTPKGFKFFPKIGQDISHWGRLKDTEKLVDNYIYNVSHLKEKLGVPFLQMHDNFAPKDFDRVKGFIDYWPKDFPLALELRHTDWYNDSKTAQQLYGLLEKRNILNVLVDTAGRRDLMHMRLTTPNAFVRFVGANHPTDYKRIDSWVERIAKWKEQGLSELYFFVHQNIEMESALLSAYLIESLNKTLKTQLAVPKLLSQVSA
jgi:uncharacterized protein YecE (DUF72 family)